MRFGASTFLVLLTFTFHMLPFVLCSDVPVFPADNGRPQQIDGVHRRGLVVERQTVIVTETDTTGVVIETTQVDATVTGTGTAIIQTTTSTRIAAPSTTQAPTLNVGPPETTLPTNPSGEPLTACPTGHYQCAPSFAGGCCPNGFGCAVNECIPPATVTATRTCMPSSSSCPVSVRGGCCPDNYSCGVTICSPLATASAVVITGATFTNTQPPFAMTATQVVMKGTDIPINAKIQLTTTTPRSPTDSSGPSKGAALPTITLVGIIVGSVIGALLLVGVAWFTRRRLRWRGNTDAFAGAPTGHFYDPNMPTAAGTTVPNRTEEGFLNQIQQPYGYLANPASPTQPAVAEMEVKYYQHNQDGLPDFEENQDRVELGDTSFAQHAPHEVEGDQPVSPGRMRRRSGLGLLGNRRSSTGGGGETHF